MLKKTLVALTWIACFGVSSLQAKPESIEKPVNETMVVGTNAEFPPFCYLEDKIIVGFDIDVAKEVARRMGKAIQFKDMPFDALLPEIILDRVDFVAAGMSMTKERAKRVSFTKPYLTGDPLVVFSTIEHSVSLEDLKGKTVVVIEGYTADLYMSSQEGVDLIRLATQADGFMAIKCGRAAAFVTAKSTVDAFFGMQESAPYHTETIEGTGDTCALVIPKSKPEVLKDIQSALDEMMEDGTMTEIKNKWKLQ